ncbi:hypothetical protein N656DRAFT_335698 [Canariomyces notabilis]|uniref:Clock-controlled protein 6 n=1 Tax=Canariomyces notabilis TaxID=2074819 RepID=A0AAN6QFP5_9PEZI|nr:hypothetical protein N656DRAFT_335698 [Canariomyces arenarius]
MKFTAAVLALAAGASAFKNVTYTTEVVTAVTTFCPVATEVEVGGSTYTATTLTITNCPGGCTVVRPITTVSSVICHSCTSAPVYSNTTTGAPVPPKPTLTSSVGTVSQPAPTKSALPTAGAGKAAALSGGALAGLLGLAAFAL